MTSFYDQMKINWEYDSFSEFLLINGQVPAAPFQLLPIIANRARNLLSTRSDSEIINAASLIDGVLETYFDQLRGQVIKDLIFQYPDPTGILTKKFLDPEDIKELDRRQCDIEDFLCGGKIPELDMPVPIIPNRFEESDIESLKIVGKFLPYQDGAFLNGFLYEYFGVLALRYIEDCIKTYHQYGALTEIDCSENSTNMAGIEKNLTPKSSIILCAQPFAYSLEAICYGEHLAELQRLGVKQETTEESIEEAIKKAAKELGVRGANARHVETRQLKDDAYSHYLNNENKFKRMSNEDVAIELRKVVYLKHRTLVDYASEFRKLRSAGKL